MSHATAVMDALERLWPNAETARLATARRLADSKALTAPTPPSSTPNTETTS